MTTTFDILGELTDFISLYQSPHLLLTVIDYPHGLGNKLKKLNNVTEVNQRVRCRDEICLTPGPMPFATERVAF